MRLQKMPPQTVVLTYHDVILERGTGSVWFDTTVDELEEQLDWLRDKEANFISLDDLCDHLTEGSPLPDNPVAITFADNYLGFYAHALPILRERKIPVTMFVHTGFVGSQQGRPKMTWEQLKELGREGLVTVASQTVSHPADLTKLSEGQLLKEFVDSKKALEDQLWHGVHYLAYPNGKWDQRAARLAEQAGYKMAFTEDQRPAETATSLFDVPRYVHTKLKDAFPVR